MYVLKLLTYLVLFGPQVDHSLAINLLHSSLQHSTRWTSSSSVPLSVRQHLLRQFLWAYVNIFFVSSFERTSTSSSVGSFERTSTSSSSVPLSVRQHLLRQFPWAYVNILFVSSFERTSTSYSSVPLNARQHLLRQFLRAHVPLDGSPPVVFRSSSPLALVRFTG